jgi:hypothetical protein
MLTDLSIQEMKFCIREGIQGIPVHMLRKVMDDQTTCRDVPYLQWNSPDISSKNVLENLMLFHVAYHCSASYLIFKSSVHFQVISRLIVSAPPCSIQTLWAGAAINRAVGVARSTDR